MLPIYYSPQYFSGNSTKQLPVFYRPSKFTIGPNYFRPVPSRPIPANLKFQQHGPAYSTIVLPAEPTHSKQTPLSSSSPSLCSDEKDNSPSAVSSSVPKTQLASSTSKILFSNFHQTNSTLAGHLQS